MQRERLIIYTPDGKEKTVYSICDQHLTELLKITFLELFLFKEKISPKHNALKNAANSPIKIVKNKINITSKTSKIISMNDLTFECNIQMPSNIDEHFVWKPLCEDLVELNIYHKNIDNYHFSIFSIKNSCDCKNYFFIDLNTLKKTKQLAFLLGAFLEENLINKSFTTVYKKIINNNPTDDITQLINTNDNLKNNSTFIMTCITESQQPESLLISFLKNNIINHNYPNGKLFLNNMQKHINISSDSVKKTIISTYDKFLLNKRLIHNISNKLTTNTNQQTKLIKI